MDERDQAIRAVLHALRSPLVLMSVPDREDARALAALHKITASELLDLAIGKARASPRRESRSSARSSAGAWSVSENRKGQMKTPSYHTGPHPHPGGCEGCRDARVCNGCGKPFEFPSRAFCTNGRCYQCHIHCTSGGGSQPGHGYGKLQERRLEGFGQRGVCPELDRMPL